MKKILFLCTGNSCRSQMAHGLANCFKKNKYEFYSAGITTHGLNPLAVQVMQEIGIDISQYNSNCVDEYKDIQFEKVFTVCDGAHEACPIFKSHTVLVHIGFDDPPFLCKSIEDEEAVMIIYRRVRDEIKSMIQNNL